MQSSNLDTYRRIGPDHVVLTKLELERLGRSTCFHCFVIGANSDLCYLDLEHNLFLLTLDNKLCLSPKSEGAKRVLDVGTGTGIWAIDYGELVPSTAGICF
jgi:methylase of polypeptide subunit release factors